MTLIITALSENAVFQVSDRRLTRTNGSLYDDLAIKAICVSCVDASFCIAYTGLAQIGSCRTDEWVTDYLASIKAGELGFTELLDSLQKHVASTFRGLRNLGRIRGITFVIAGFGRPGPFMGLLSNVEDGNGNWLRDIDDNFRARFYFRNDKPMRKLDLVINGREKATETLDKAIQKIRQRYLGKSQEKVMAVLVQLIREAAGHPKGGYMIGRNCMGVMVNPTGCFSCQDYPENDSPQQYMPHIILRGASYKDIKIWTGSGAPPWWSKDKS